MGISATALTRTVADISIFGIMEAMLLSENRSVGCALYAFTEIAVPGKMGVPMI